MFGALLPMLSSFGSRQRLDSSVVKLLGDLRQTQQFARVQKDGYRFYGIHFCNEWLGKDGDRQGYRIVRFEPQDVSAPVNLTDYTVVKSSVLAESPEILEDTFFDKGVLYDDRSELGPASSLMQADIVFTPEGSATTDGEIDSDSLLNTTNDEIMITNDKNSKTIEISALTGYARIRE